MVYNFSCSNFNKRNKFLNYEILWFLLFPQDDEIWGSFSTHWNEKWLHYLVGKAEGKRERERERNLCTIAVHITLTTLKKISVLLQQTTHIRRHNACNAVQYLISVGGQNESHQSECFLRSCFPLSATYCLTPAMCVNGTESSYMPTFLCSSTYTTFTGQQYSINVY